MSIALMSYAWRMPCDNLSTKLVLMKLTDHASDDGVCWPSWGHLTKHTGCSRATVARSLAELEKLGVISVQQRLGTSNVYTIHQEAIVKLTPVDVKQHNSKGYHDKAPIDPSHDDTTPSQDDTTTRLTVRPPPSHDETQIIKESPPKPSKNLTEEGMLYKQWCDKCQISEDQQTTIHKKEWWNNIKPVFLVRGYKHLRWAINSYLQDWELSKAKFYTVRSFVKNINSYLPPDFTPRIDKYSDLSPEVQKENQLQAYRNQYGID